MRNINEIRSSIKDLILKAENEELLNIQNKESQNLSNESENSENQLSDEILKQINLKVNLPKIVNQVIDEKINEIREKN